MQIRWKKNGTNLSNLDGEGKNPELAKSCQKFMIRSAGLCLSRGRETTKKVSAHPWLVLWPLKAAYCSLQPDISFYKVRCMCMLGWGWGLEWCYCRKQLLCPKVSSMPAVSSISGDPTQSLWPKTYFGFSLGLPVVSLFFFQIEVFLESG